MVSWIFFILASFSSYQYLSYSHFSNLFGTCGGTDRAGIGEVTARTASTTYMIYHISIYLHRNQSIHLLSFAAFAAFCMPSDYLLLSFLSLSCRASRTSSSTSFSRTRQSTTCYVFLFFRHLFASSILVHYNMLTTGLAYRTFLHLMSSYHRSSSKPERLEGW